MYKYALVYSSGKNSNVEHTTIVFSSGGVITDYTGASQTKRHVVTADLVLWGATLPSPRTPARQLSGMQ